MQAADIAAVATSAIATDNVKYLAQLLDNGDTQLDDKGGDGYSYLTLAAHFGSKLCAELLLNRRMDPNFREHDGCTALVIAVQRGQHAVLDLLLRRGAQLQVKLGLPPLFFAAQTGRPLMVRKLIRLKANPNCYFLKATPLYLATQRNHYEAVQALLESRADVNMRSKRLGFSALIFAIHANFQEVRADAVYRSRK